MPQEVLLAQFSLYVHKGGLKPDSFHFYIAGMLLNTLSDHFPYFISLAYSKSGKRTDKYIEVKQTSHVSINNF